MDNKNVDITKYWKILKSELQNEKSMNGIQKKSENGKYSGGREKNKILLIIHFKIMKIQNIEFVKYTKNL